MNKIGVLVFVLLSIQLASSASIDMNPDYKQGETIIAKISGNFIDSILEENVFFYRGHVKIPMNYDVAKIGEYFYVIASTIGKTENNYSLRIQGIQYSNPGGIIVEDDIIKNFSIINKTADFAIDKGFIITSQGFSIEVQSLQGSSVKVDVDNFNKTNSVDSVTLSAQQIKTIDFQVTKSNVTVFGTITLSSSNTEYKIPVEIFPVPGTETLCGNSAMDSGEECDGDEWGNVTGCDDFGFDSGSLSCNSQGTINECTFDTNNCFDKSAKECTYDFDCDSNEECVDNECVKEVECNRDRDCSSNRECVYNECVLKDKECDFNRDCRNNYECSKGECVLKDNLECTRNSDCNNLTKECVYNKCVQKISPEEQKTCSELGGKICGLKETCNGESQNVGNNVCCLGFCEDSGGGPNSKIIGWSILGIIGVFLLFFYLKYKMAKRKTPDLSKIGGLKR